jgi:hypothetical protein
MENASRRAETSEFTAEWHQPPSQLRDRSLDANKKLPQKEHRSIPMSRQHYSAEGDRWVLPHQSLMDTKRIGMEPS